MPYWRRYQYLALVHYLAGGVYQEPYDAHSITSRYRFPDWAAFYKGAAEAIEGVSQGRASVSCSCRHGQGLSAHLQPQEKWRVRLQLPLDAATLDAAGAAADAAGSAADAESGALAGSSSSTGDSNGGGATAVAGAGAAEAGGSLQSRRLLRATRARRRMRSRSGQQRPQLGPNEVRAVGWNAWHARSSAVCAPLLSARVTVHARDLSYPGPPMLNHNSHP